MNVILISHLTSIKDIGLVICSKLLIRGTVWSCPANSHFSCCYYFKFKVPLPLSYSVGFIWSEHSELLSREMTWV